MNVFSLLPTNGPWTFSLSCLKTITSPPTLLLAWIAAVAIIFFREWVSRRTEGFEPYTVILLLLPFIAVFCAGVAGYYPFVGGRHTVFLAPFVIAALSFLLATVNRQKLWAAILVAVLLVGASNTSGQMFDPSITKENQSRALMKAAMKDIQQTIPTGGLIMTNYQSALLLVYYFCGPELILPAGTFNLPASRVKCNGYTIASFQTWLCRPRFSFRSLEKSRVPNT